jgi:NADPH:quinone reductase-like Zn-dependent oxidoreductase
MAIQLAKHLGAYVATTAAAAETGYVKQLGADETIDYKTQRFDEILRGYDAVLDTVSGETYQRSFTVLNSGGVIVSMLEQPNQALMSQYQVKAIAQATKVTSERLTEVAKLVDDGVLKVKIDKTFNLEQTAAALEHLKSGHPKGKVVIQIKNAGLNA